MRKKVYEFFKTHPGGTHHACAAELGISELEALKIINELTKNGMLKLGVLPLGNDINPNCSTFYSVYKAYHD